MNPYAVIIAGALVLAYGLHALAQTLNLRALSPALPSEFEGLYDPDQYRRSQEYTRVRARFDLVTSTVHLAKVMGFWAAGGFNALDIAVRAWNLPPVATGLIYIGVLAAANEIVSLPFEAYSVFVIEERFGFNKTTFRTFVTDRLKAYVLGALLGGLLLAGILSFLTWAGSQAWLYIWAAGALFAVILQFVAPTWIMPLFNKFTPLADGQLKTAIFDYARSVNFSLKEIFVVDGSRRSSKANAFFTGFGKNKRIGLFDTLIQKHSIPELVAVLAHEIGHYQMRHVVKGLLLAVAHFGVLSWLLSIFVTNPSLFDAFHMRHISPYAGLVFFLLLYTPVSLALSFFLHGLSRRHEFEADRYAVRTYRNPNALAQALKKLSADNLANLTPHPVYVLLNYSHPPVLERVRAIYRIPI
jgi:STE24 endopeptidase